jgi:hypothetical protein
MSLQIPALSKAVTAATSSGVLTIDDTTPVWPGQIGWLAKAGNYARIQVVEILSTTTFRARAVPKINDPGFGNGLTPSSMFADLSAFTGGSCTFNCESQVVGTNSDGGKMPAV